MFDKKFVPEKPFSDFKWKWACLQCTEGLNDPVILLGVLFRMRKLELLNKGIKYSSDEFARELIELSKDTEESVGVDLARRTGARNLIRNSGQYWRALNLIVPGGRSGKIELTDFGRRVADRDISQTEFAAITVQTFRLPNPQVQSSEECELWLKHGLIIYPLKLILEAAFRKAVLQACERCIITNVTMPEVLEAAHIKPFKYKGEDTVANGFAMRTDIHTLFDTGHLRISPEGVIELSSRARMDYGASIPPRIVVPDFTNKDFLRWRYENYNGI